MIFFPLTGLMTLFCIATLVVSFFLGFVKKKITETTEHVDTHLTFQQVTLSLVTISIVFSLALSMVVYVLQPSFQAIAVYAESHSTEGMEVCDNPTPHEILKSVIFRFDDVSANFHTNATQSVIEAANKEGVPIVMGVIPSEIQTDLELLRSLRDSRCTHEIASHGLTHDQLVYQGRNYAEFEILNRQQTDLLIKQSNSLFQEYLRLTPQTFIPPEGKISAEAQRAAKLGGFAVISDNDTGFYDVDADMWNYEMSSLNSAATVLSQCEVTYQFGDVLCVLVLHPQDFVDRSGNVIPARIAEVQKVFRYYASSGIEVSTFARYEASVRALRATTN